MGKIYVILKNEPYGEGHCKTTVVAASTMKSVAEFYVNLHDDVTMCEVDDLVVDEPVDDSSVYHVWMEGFASTGQTAKACHLGDIEAPDFLTACEIAVKRKFPDDYESLYNKERNTFWGCRLFNNEYDARKAFG